MSATDRYKTFKLSLMAVYIEGLRAQLESNPHGLFRAIGICTRIDALYTRIDTLDGVKLKTYSCNLAREIYKQSFYFSHKDLEQITIMGYSFLMLLLVLGDTSPSLRS